MKHVERFVEINRETLHLVGCTSETYHKYVDVVYNFINQKTCLHFLRLCQGHSSPNDYDSFPALKRNLDGHMFNDDDEVQTAVTRLLETQDID